MPKPQQIKEEIKTATSTKKNNLEYVELAANTMATLKYGADNIDKGKRENPIQIGKGEPKRMAALIEEARDKATALAKESIDFAPNKEVAKIYAAAHYGRLYRMGNCDVQSSLVITSLLAMGRDCIHAGVPTKLMPTSKMVGHAFAIVPARGQRSKTTRGY